MTRITGVVTKSTKVKLTCGYLQQNVWKWLAEHVCLQLLAEIGRGEWWLNMRSADDDDQADQQRELADQGIECSKRHGRNFAVDPCDKRSQRRTTRASVMWSKRRSRNTRRAAALSTHWSYRWRLAGSSTNVKFLRSSREWISDTTIRRKQYRWHSDGDGVADENQQNNMRRFPKCIYVAYVKKAVVMTRIIQRDCRGMSSKISTSLLPTAAAELECIEHFLFCVLLMTMN